MDEVDVLEGLVVFQAGERMDRESIVIDEISGSRRQTRGDEYIG